MDFSNILTEIDKQIAQLQQAKALLSGSPVPKNVGRPPKVVTTAVVVKARKPLSPEAKARIAAAQKKRWAKAKKAAVVKKAVPVVVKKTAPAPAKKTPTKRTMAPAKTGPVKTA
jgi:hypothetical protein